MNLHATLAWINRLLWTVLVCAVIAVGAVVGLGRHYIGYLEQYREPLIAELERRSGYEISVDRLRGEWHGVVPQVEIDNLRISAPGESQPLLELQQLTLHFGLFHSLQEQTLVFHRVAGSGLKLALVEQAPQQWKLRGLRDSGGKAFDPRPLQLLLLAVRRARLTDVDVTAQFFEGTSAQLHGDLRFERQGKFRRMALDLQVDSGAPNAVAESAAPDASPARKAAPLQATLEVNGDLRRPQRTDAALYAEFDDLDLTPLLPAAQAFGLDLHHGRIDGRAWLTWRDGVFSASGQLGAETLELAALTGRAMAPLQQFSASFDFEQRDGVRQIWVPALSAQWGGKPVQLSQLWLRRELREPDAEPEPLQLALPRLELAPLRDALLAGGALTPTQQGLLETLAPTGTLLNLQLLLPTTPAQLPKLALRTVLDEVGIEPWHEAPGASGLDGYIELGAGGGRAVLDSRDVSVHFPHVFEQPLRFSDGRADVRWQTASGRTQVRSGAIALRSEAGAATAKVSLDLAHQPGEIASRMDLLVALRGSDAQHRDAFLPHHLDAGLLAWLKRAVTAGELPRGAFLYRGSLRPGDRTNRTVQLHLDVENGELAYQPEWPPLRDLSAQLWLDDSHLQVGDIRAQLLDGIELQRAEVTLAPDPKGGMWLTVDGAATALNDDALRLLRDTPLRERIGSQLDNWQWQGPVVFDLALGLGIGSARPMQVAVDAELGPGKLRFDDLDLLVDKVQGPLGYRAGKGLRSSGITGTLFGKPLRATVDTETSGAVEVDIRGRLALARLAPRLPEGVATRLSGETDLRLTLNLAPEASRLRASSSLRGIAIDLPPPYAKAAAAELPLRAEMMLAGTRTLNAEVGDWGSVELRWPAGGGAPESGRLRLGVDSSGKQATSLSAEPGALLPGRLLITGTLPPLTLDDWRPLQAELGGAGSGLAVELNQLRSSELKLGTQTLRDPLLSGRGVPTGWLLQASADSFDGEVLLATEGPWRVHLRRLQLPPPSGSDEPSTALESVDPRKLPALDLQIDELWRGEQLWGSVRFALRPIAGGVAARQLQADIREIRFGAETPASMTWLRDEGGDRTWFDGRLNVADLASVMANWGFEPAIVTERGQLDASVSWAGRPDQYALRLLNGDATLALRKGQLLSAGASAEGAVKLVGIFNVANLLRRLQLDFSDLYKQGISFERLDANLALRNGVIELTKPLAITGPSSRFRISGVLDLNSDQVDMQLTAILPLAGNLPWIAALAGGLPVAAGVYVASKVFGEQVDRFSSAVYNITGSWRDPEVKISHIFDASSDAGKNEKVAPPRSLQGAKP